MKSEQEERIQLQEGGDSVIKQWSRSAPRERRTAQLKGEPFRPKAEGCRVPARDPEDCWECGTNSSHILSSKAAWARE